MTAFRHERRRAWFDGLEAAFRHFGGVPSEVLLDNAEALVLHHDATTREVVFNERFHSFARYWDFRPRACAPYRARTRGKDERGVGYVERNAIAGRSFASWAELQAHLAWTLDGFDFDAQPSLDPKQVHELATCRRVANGDALLLLGPPIPLHSAHLAITL